MTPDTCETNIANANNWVKGKKYYGRFNVGVITLNLVDIALSSHKDMDLFLKLFEERAELCHKAHKERIGYISKTKASEAPIMWMYGALARLDADETIDKLLENGYSTLSLGYVGVHEMTQAMLGVSHTTKEGEEFALKVMNHLNDTCQKWKKETGFGFGLYGTPKMLGL